MLTETASTEWIPVCRDESTRPCRGDGCRDSLRKVHVRPFRAVVAECHEAEVRPARRESCLVRQEARHVSVS